MFPIKCNCIIRMSFWFYAPPFQLSATSRAENARSKHTGVSTPVMLNLITPPELVLVGEGVRRPIYGRLTSIKQIKNMLCIEINARIEELSINCLISGIYSPGPARLYRASSLGISQPRQAIAPGRLEKCRASHDEPENIRAASSGSRPDWYEHGQGPKRNHNA
jgi:hypothetical protein